MEQAMSTKAFLTSARFRRDQINGTIVFPNGARSRGSSVPDAATVQRLRRRIMWAVIVLMFSFAGGLAVHAFWGRFEDWAVKTFRPGWCFLTVN